VKIKPFRGVRPRVELADRVASPPYDVLDTDEARQMAEGSFYSFLHIIRPEIDLPPETDPYNETVYKKGAENFNRYRKENILIQDDTPCFYIYRQIMGDHIQTGIVAVASIEEYDRNLIKKHEMTKPVKEDDRVNHIKALNAQTGPVFLTYKAQPEIEYIVEGITSEPPVYDFTAEDGTRHTFWVVRARHTIIQIEEAFQKIAALYIADGHHRTAAASRVCKIRKEASPEHNGEEEYNYFLSVIFPDNQMYIMDYNRVITDLYGLSKDNFLDEVGKKFTVISHGSTAIKPAEKNCFSMYLDKEWYLLKAKEGTFDPKDPVNRLDVTILQNNLLHPILKIQDPRNDKRIDFVGGIRSLGELVKLVNSGEMQVAFTLYPTTIIELMTIADAGKTMPPKSTWFEPKLRSGLIIHVLD